MIRRTSTRRRISLERDGIPLGLVFQAEPQPTMDQRIDDLKTKAKALTTEQMVASYGV